MKLNKEEKLFAIGKTKVFLKEMMRDNLEVELKRIQGEKAIVIQKNYKKYLYAKRYQ